MFEPVVPNYQIFLPEAIEQLKKQGEMTVPFKVGDKEVGEVTVITDDVGIRIIETSSTDAMLRRMLLNSYVMRFGRKS